MTRAGSVFALLLVAVGLWLWAAPAVAHDSLVSSSPQESAQLARVPASVVLTFTEPALPLGTQVIVTGPAGPVQQGAPVLVDNAVTQPLRGGAPAGNYTVDWRVTSADGHPISGSFRFSAQAAGVPGSAPVDIPAGAAASNSSAGWIWLLAGGMALGSAVAVLRHGRERRSVGPTSSST